ncbi:MAG: hypothetical protein B6I19_10710 [Bacteroidetes bacterium 4572_114]|nr:MAG: hypothetical protein B6I19_10710 [Bacteroidetes bacterium 4572_114]
MKTISNRNFLTISFALLIVLNLFLLGVLWFTRMQGPAPPFPPNQNHRPRDAGDIIARRLKLSNQQRIEFHKIREEHVRRTRHLMDQIHHLKEEILIESFAPNSDTARIAILAGEISEKQEDFELFLSKHFLELKKICTPKQRLMLKDIFNDVMERNKPPKFHPHKPAPPKRF